MKIAINRCYGGFSLSDKAIEMLMTRKGLECHRYIQTKYLGRDGVNEYTRITADNDNVEYHSMLIDYLTTDLGEFVEDLLNEYCWYYEIEIERNDKDLITVIEELGEAANGDCGEIRIVEIPDDVSWEIRDDEGFESVHEKHRSWC